VVQERRAAAKVFLPKGLDPEEQSSCSKKRLEEEACTSVEQSEAVTQGEKKEEPEGTAYGSPAASQR